MVESMYMATHSSFFAMVAVAKQLGRLPNALGGILGLLKMIRWLRGLITGRPVAPPDPNAPKPSKKPLIIIFLTLFSIPIHMYRLIGSHAARLPRMSMELIALAFEGKVQNPVAEAYDPVEWKSLWLPISVGGCGNCDASSRYSREMASLYLFSCRIRSISLILLLWTLCGFRRDTLVERKSFWGAVHYEQVL
ncbi:hypothetical protein BU17DRAFT_103249 [Hysterangium stoloniferum]|nr:hypothetical protein BU17DRAFT_103249 [Hysterangium stoloniferum]